MAIKQIKDINHERKINTPPIPTETQKLDDQTPIDDTNRQRKLSGLQGFDKRIPAGEEKTIKVLKLHIGQGNPIIIKDSDNELIGTYNEVKIEGESSLFICWKR